MWLASVARWRGTSTRACTVSPGGQLALEAHEHGLIAVEPVDGLDLSPHRVRGDLAGVGDLAAALGVERRARELDEREALRDGLDREHLGLDVQLVVAHERARRRRAREARDALVVDAVAAAGGRAGALALRPHVALEALEVDPETGLARELGRQLDGEPVRVVQLEDVAGVQVRLALRRAPGSAGRRAGASPWRASARSAPPRTRSGGARRRGARRAAG